MESKLEGEVTLMFLMGGISKAGKPYLQVSNGRKELWINIPKDLQKGMNENTFADFSEDDPIVLDVVVTVGGDTVTLVAIR